MPTKPTVPPALRDAVDPDSDEPFDMMSFMKKQRLAKEREMLEKERQDPNYKPLSPTALKAPDVPIKDQQKLDEAERKRQLAQPEKKGKGKGKGKDEGESLFDQI